MPSKLLFRNSSVTMLLKLLEISSMVIKSIINFPLFPSTYLYPYNLPKVISIIFHNWIITSTYFTNQIYFESYSYVLAHEIIEISWNKWYGERYSLVNFDLDMFSFLHHVFWFVVNVEVDNLVCAYFFREWRDSQVFVKFSIVDSLFKSVLMSKLIK